MPESKIENLATPGSIQPHGFLVVLHPLDFKILQVSANIETLFSAPPEKCLGEPISAFMPEKDFILLRDFVETHTLNVPMTLELKRSSADQADQFDTWIFHRTSQGVITEVEPRVTSQLNNPRLYNAIREISALVPNSSLRTICDATADQIRTLTGFERILVYEYDSRYNSTIIAESIFAGAKSNIGLRFPATPMTNQLQKLYTKNTVRMMPSLSAVSIPILPAVSPVNNQPLDLTFSALRGVSNYHKESMEGMNVEASLAFALVMDGHIWGFLGCYHSRQHFVSYDVRVACEFMVHLLSTHIEYFKKAQAISEDAKRKAALVEIERLLSHKNNTPQEFAKKNLHLFINLVHATGVVYVSDSEFECCKMTPGLEVSSSIRKYLAENSKQEVHSGNSSEVIATKRSYNFLSMQMDSSGESYLIWYAESDKDWGSADLPAVRGLKSVFTNRLLQQFDNLNEEKRELETIQQELEKRVAQRTQELEQLNDLLQEEIQERKRAEEVIIQATKLSALGEMAAGIAHEINNPLTVIQGRAFQLARGLKEKTITTDDAVVMSQKIIETAQRISKITTGLRAFAREGSADPYEVIKVRNLLEDTLSFCESRLRNHGIELYVEAFPNDLSVDCQTVQISQVLLNLISNAHDAVESLEQKWIRIRVALESGWVCFYISDSGCGISPDILPRIFDPFFTTKRIHKGTGLGLSIARGIVDKHGGKLEYVPGPNTCFCLSLRQNHRETKS